MSAAQLSNGTGFALREALDKFGRALARSPDVASVRPLTAGDRTSRPTKGKSMKKQKFKFSEQQPLDTCIRQLEALLEGLKSGTLSLSQGEEKLWLRPAGAMDIELRAEQSGDRENLEIHLGWRRASLHVVSRPAEDMPPKTVRNWHKIQSGLDARSGDDAPPASARNLDAASGAS
jgi:amphi-Trp domain-containing protein